jgi:hypothetical protein
VTKIAYKNQTPAALCLFELKERASGLNFSLSNQLAANIWGKSVYQNCTGAATDAFF